ncbi:hypothetical protein HDU81_000629, partial [Chytriomyces hyalinus]
YAQLVESVLSPRPPFAEDINKCLITNCPGFLQALPIPGEAYQHPKVGHSVLYTSECTVYNQKYAHKGIIQSWVQKFALDNDIDISASAVDNFRCAPPSVLFLQSHSDLCLFAMNLLEFQFHHATHTSSCFKCTLRTPDSKICCFLIPKLSNLEVSALDPETCIMKSFRLLGLEYYNLCNLYWARLSMDNMD